MAVPGFFNTSYGLALMRLNASTSEWFFVDWVNGTDFAYDSPGPGTWFYAVWLVAGDAIYGTANIVQVQYVGKGQLGVQQLKR